MKLAVGSDERTHLTDVIIEELRKRGHEVELYGPLNDEPLQWVDVARAVAERVASGQVDQGVLCCWTGTGVSIAANKVPGVRAALCFDAETARGARMWNDANILCLSLRSTAEAEAREILDRWFDATPDPSEAENVRKLAELDRQHAR